MPSYTQARRNARDELRRLGGVTRRMLKVDDGPQQLFALHAQSVGIAHPSSSSSISVRLSSSQPCSRAVVA